MNAQNLHDLKIYVLNAMILGITSFAAIEMSLKIILLLVTTGYTISKWIDLSKRNKEEKNGK